MRAMVAALAVSATMLAGCAGPESGRVNDTRYTAGFTYFISCGSKGQLCPAYSPPRWDLDLYADSGEHGWTAVDETTWHKCQRGEYYPDCARR